MAKIKQLKLVDATEIYPKASFDSVVNISDSNKTLKDTLTEYYGPLSKGEGIDGTQDTIEGRLYLLEEEYSDTTKYRKFVKDIKDFGAKSTLEGVQLSINTDIQPVVTGDTHSGEPLTTTIPLVTTTTNGIMSSSDKNKLDAISDDTTVLSERGLVVPFKSSSDSTITVQEGVCPNTSVTDIYWNTSAKMFVTQYQRKWYKNWQANISANIPPSTIYNTDNSRTKHIYRDEDAVVYHFVYSTTASSEMYFNTLEILHNVTVTLPELDYPVILPFKGTLVGNPTVLAQSTSVPTAIYYIYNTLSAYHGKFVAKTSDGSYYANWATKYHHGDEYNSHPAHNVYISSGEVYGITDDKEMISISDFDDYI